MKDIATITCIDEVISELKLMQKDMRELAKKVDHVERLILLEKSVEKSVSLPPSFFHLPYGVEHIINIPPNITCERGSTL